MTGEPRMTGELDPYEILQVRPDASDDVIRAAYRALARRLHPDHSEEPGSAALMVQVNWAWEILSDPERRSAFDRERKNGSQVAAAGQPSEAGPSAAGGSAGGSAGATQAGTGARGWGSGRPSGFGGGPTVERRTADGRVVEWRTAADGTGGAGPPPGRPSGSILPFGRFIAWSIGEIVRFDPGYLEWLDGRPEGAPYRAEINETLTRHGWRQRPGAATQAKQKGR